MRRVGRTTVGVLLVWCLLTAGVGGAAAASGFGTAPFQTGDVDPDTVVLRTDVAENGSATWTIEYRVRLDDENTTAAFESLQSDVRTNRSVYVGRFHDRMNRTADVAANATGRSMSIRNVSVTAETRQLPQEYGVVSYRFRWTNFAVVDGRTLRIGDALSGFFLDSETSLVVSWPSDYRAATISPEPDERSDTAVTWRGPADFGPSEPRIVVEPPNALARWALAGLAVALLGGVGAVWWFRRQSETAGEDAAGGEAAAPAETATEAAETGDEDAAEDEAAATPPDELLSPEERVLQFVEENGGRVKQQDVVSAFDWTAARTSQVVGNLRDEGKLETFRLGRENVLTLPDDEDDEEFGDPTPDP